MAKQLLSLPDVPLVIEMWCAMDGYGPAAEMTEYDPEGTAIIYQKFLNESIATKCDCQEAG